MSECPFKVGSRVRHVSYGAGEVMAIEDTRIGSRKLPVLVIHFITAGTVRLMWPACKQTLGEIK